MQLKNPFFSIWSSDTGSDMAVSFINTSRSHLFDTTEGIHEYRDIYMNFSVGGYYPSKRDHDVCKCETIQIHNMPLGRNV
jgi:hypothetical protein